MMKIKIIGSEKFTTDNELECALNEEIAHIERMGGIVHFITYVSNSDGCLKTIVIEYIL